MIIIHHNKFKQPKILWHKLNIFKTIIIFFDKIKKILNIMQAKKRILVLSLQVIIVKFY